MARAAPPPATLADSYIVREDDTFVDIARSFDIGYVELVAANPGVDPWLPAVGRSLVIPKVHLLPAAPARGIVINIADLRLYYFPPGTKEPITFPIGIGQQGWDIPLSQTEVVRKQANPTWIPPASIRAEEPDLPLSVPPGPDNPMGAFALYLGWTNYAIHGTNTPYAVGRRVTHGCIRLYPEDIARLFPLVPVHTPVSVVDQPFKLGWREGELYLEAHATGTQVDELEEEGRITQAAAPDIEGLVKAAAGAVADRVDWALVNRVAVERTGVPTRVSKPLPEGATYSLVQGLQPAVPPPPPPVSPPTPAQTAEAEAPSVALGPWWLWLGSLRSESELAARWEALRRAHANLLQGLDSTTRERKSGANAVYHRLYAGPLPSLDAATKLCARLRLQDANAACVPMLLPSS